MQFPNVDPIPVPAPIWLMKGLGLLTLALHFFAVQALIGSLLAAIVLSWRAQSTKSPKLLTAAAVIGRRLPIVMTYVINLGVPPLLFAQVLYGRALYTSSILMAVLWISVIPLLMASYWLLYGTADRTSKGLPAHWHALGALLIAGGIGQIYSMNMTLMLRPEVWQGMYAHTATGLQTPPHDPTMMPRWLFMMSGGLIAGGLWIAIQSNVKSIEGESKAFLKRLGSGMAIGGILVQAVVGVALQGAIPEAVGKGLQTPYYQATMGLWAVGAILAMLLAALQFGRKGLSAFLSWAAATAAFLSIAGMVLYRDGIRDVTLLGKGFDVWKRTENANWSVIGLFLLLFLAGLGTAGWLLLVMKQARPISEEVKA